MIKFIAAAIWISLATTGALLYSFQSAQKSAETAEAEEPTAFKGLDYVKTGIISVPIFKEGRVYGYFLTRLVYTAEAAKLKELKLPAEALLSDQVYTYLFDNPEIDFSSRDTVDLEAFREGIRASVNQRIGTELVEEVLVEQIDFLPKEEARSSSIRQAAIAQQKQKQKQQPQEPAGH